MGRRRSVVVAGGVTWLVSVVSVSVEAGAAVWSPVVTLSVSGSWFIGVPGVSQSPGSVAQHHLWIQCLLSLSIITTFIMRRVISKRSDTINLQVVAVSSIAVFSAGQHSVAVVQSRQGCFICLSCGLEMLNVVVGSIAVVIVVD